VSSGVLCEGILHRIIIQMISTQVSYRFSALHKPCIGINYTAYYLKYFLGFSAFVPLFVPLLTHCKSQA